MASGVRSVGGNMQGVVVRTSRGIGIATLMRGAVTALAGR